MSTTIKKAVAHYSILLIGVAILAFGLYNIHSQSKITEGGVLGSILLLEYWFKISPSISGLIIDFSCYALAFKLLGKDFLKNAIIASLGFSSCYRFFESMGYTLPNLSSIPLLAALLGGLFVGVGVGLVVSRGGAAGGDDALALVIAKTFKWRISQAYFFTDFVILTLSLSYIPFTNIFYSLISVTLSSFIIEKLQNCQLLKQI